MSVPDLVAGTYVSVLVEDPDAPTANGTGTFLTLCGMTTHTLTEQVNTRDRFVRDCDEPGGLPFRRLIATGMQWDLSASGLYNRAQGELIKALKGKKPWMKFLIGEPADDAVYSSYFKGKAMLTQRQITGSDEDDTAAELTFASDGEWVEEEVA